MSYLNDANVHDITCPKIIFMSLQTLKYSCGFMWGFIVETIDGFIVYLAAQGVS